MEPGVKRVASVAALCMLQAGAATAADGFELVSAQGKQLSFASIELGALGIQRQLASESWLLESGLPKTQANHLAWELTDEPPPVGSGQRSAGTVHADQSQVFTLTNPGRHQATLTSSGLITSTASWFVQNGDGTLDRSGVGAHQMSNFLELSFVLTQPAALRLSGRLSSGNSETYSMTDLRGRLPDGTLVIVDVSVANVGQVADLLVQRQLEPGSYSMIASLGELLHTNCCNPNYIGSAAWDYSLELETVPSVPEPATLGLLLAGLGALAARQRRGRGHRADPAPKEQLT